MEENFLKITNVVYGLLEYFPEDLLKEKAKEKVLAIMEGLVLVSGEDYKTQKIAARISEDIEMLLGYLRIGKTQGWVSSINYLIVYNEYQKILHKNKVFVRSDLTKTLEGGEIEIAKNEEIKFIEKPKEIIIQNPTDPVLDKLQKKQPQNFIKLSDRQQKIIKFLEDKEKAQVMDLQQVLPTVTKRTIRRDLDELLTSGMIVRLGEFNQVFYKVS